MGFRVAGLNRLFAHGQKDAFGRPRHLPCRALAEDDAEAVAADAADDVAGAQHAVESLTDRQQDGIAGFRPEGVVDDATACRRRSPDRRREFRRGGCIRWR